MRGFLSVLAGVLAVSACVPTTPVTREPSDAARIADVKIRADELTITMTDGARCVAPRPEGVNTGWSGTTDNCGYALPYEVIFRIGGNPARFIVEEAFGAIGGDGVLMPRAEAYVIDVNGVRKQFISPLSEARLRQATPSS